MKRTVFFISDRTGITAEMLGHSLLTQFENIDLERITLPFVDTTEKATRAAQRINQAATADGIRPIVFSTMVDTEMAAVVSSANALTLDCFQIFISPLEAELGLRSSHAIGRSHSLVNALEYHQRMEAVNFAMAHDDGQSTKDLSNADVILIGVSRSGKTPTCLYMSLQFGTRAANYPLIPEDLASLRLPSHLKPLRAKTYGLTIQPERLSQIRFERRPNSKYASLGNCQREIREAEALMQQENISYLDTTTKSIEELATTILHQANLVRHVY
ncbi:MAG TPA: pyruvate, water dikinase regulatory protein [Burkholderiales bacterium]|nr:pyruvate, water dikinase regulatory protein [Burkholderiales bacterium]